MPKNIKIIFALKINSIKNSIKFLISHISGDFAYQQFLLQNKNNKIIDKKSFLRHYRNKKHSNCQRCC
jgi:hypothetical protein